MANIPKERQEWIYEQLMEQPNTSFGECFSKYVGIFSKTEQTFSKDWVKAKTRYTQYLIKANKAKDDARIGQEIEAIKIGIKTKVERTLILQNLVDDCLTDLAEGKTNDITYDKHTGKPQEFRRKMKVFEYNQTRKTLQDLQAEISKLEGDYAAVKHDVNISNVTGYRIIGAPEND